MAVQFPGQCSEVIGNDIIRMLDPAVDALLETQRDPEFPLHLLAQLLDVLGTVSVEAAIVLVDGLQEVCPEGEDSEGGDLFQEVSWAEVAPDPQWKRPDWSNASERYAGLRQLRWLSAWKRSTYTLGTVERTIWAADAGDWALYTRDPGGRTVRDTVVWEQNQRFLTSEALCSELRDDGRERPFTTPDGYENFRSKLGQLGMRYVDLVVRWSVKKKIHPAVIRLPDMD